MASAVGGIRDQIVDGESGVLVADPHDLEAFGSALAKLLSDREWAERLGAAAQLRSRELFLGDVHLERWAELMLRLNQKTAPAQRAV